MMYSRMIVVMIVGIYTSRVVLNALGVEDYGIYNLVGGLVALFAILKGGLGASTQRFLNFGIGKSDDNIEELRGIFKTAFAIYIVLALLVLVIGEILGTWMLSNKLQIPPEKADAAMYVFQLSVATIVIQIIAVPYHAVVAARERMSVIATISIFESLLKLGIALIITMVSSERLVFYAFLIFLTHLLAELSYVIYSLKNFVEVRGRLIYIERRLFRSLFSFAGWSMIGSTSGILLGQGINVLLGMFFLPFVNAARGISTIIQGTVNQVFTNVQIAVSPQIIQSYARKDYDYFHFLIFACSKYFSFLVLLIGIPLFIRLEYVMKLWLGEIPTYAIIFSRILLSACIIDALSAPLMRASDASGDIKLYNIVVGGIQIGVIPIAYIVLKLGGDPISAFYVYLIMMCFALTARLLILKMKVELPIGKFVTKVICRLALVMAISIPLCYYSNDFIKKDFIGLLLFCICTTVIISTSVLLVGMNKQERTFALSKLASLYRKKIKK